MARIVFDLDGTLIDSAPDIHGIANALLLVEGHEPLSLAQARDFIGNGANVFVQKMRIARGIDETEQDRLLASFIDRYDDAVDLTVTYPGVETALKALHGKGYSLGICTNKPVRPTKAVLNHLGLAHYFSTVWGGDSLPVHKPDPTPLNAAFDALPAGAELFVGDSDVDAETAQRAMVPFLLFTEGYRKSPVDDLPHTASFSQFGQLPDLVENLVGQMA